MSQRLSDELCVLMSSVPLSMFLFLSEVVLTYTKRIKDLLCSFVVRHLAISAHQVAGALVIVSDRAEIKGVYIPTAVGLRKVIEVWNSLWGQLVSRLSRE